MAVLNNYITPAGMNSGGFHIDPANLGGDSGSGLLASNLANASILNPAAYGTRPQVQTVLNAGLGPGQASAAAAKDIYNTLPGYKASLGNAGADIQAETSGQLPQDVINQIQQAAAERGIATGTAGSGNTNAAYLKDLGLTSLGLEQTGMSNLISQTQNLPGLPVTNSPSAYLLPGQAAQLSQNAAMANAAYGSAPDPAAAAAASLAAARSGISAGLGSGGGGSTPYPFPPSPYNAPPNYSVSGGPPPVVLGSGGTGEYVNGVLTSGGQPVSGATLPPGTGVTPTGALGDMGAIDSLLGTNLGSLSALLSKYDPNAGADTPAGTYASDTAPAGTSSGYYYAGPEEDYAAAAAGDSGDGE